MTHEFDERRILRPESESITFAEFPDGYLLPNGKILSGHNTITEPTQFEVKVPDGVGQFEVVSDCGKFKGTMRIEQEGRYRVLRKVVMKPAEPPK